MCIRDSSTTKSFLEYKQYNIHNCITKKDITSIFYVSIGIFKTYIKVLDIGLADLGFDKNKNGLVSVKPVSYTHLDVYKRQSIHSSYLGNRHVTFVNY